MAPDSERVWQITVSAPAWIDVVVDGAALAPVAFTGGHACPDVRKSLRHRIPQGQATLQVSGAVADCLRLVVRPAE